MKSFVYFVQPVNGGPVKIGCSKMPRARLSSLMAWSPFKLRLLATAPGDYVSEGQLHRRFEADRLHGEWFRPSPDLMELIDRVAATGRVDGLLMNEGSAEWCPGSVVVSALSNVLRRCDASADDLAEWCGVTKQTIRNWMNSPPPMGRWSEIVSFAAARGVAVQTSEITSRVPYEARRPPKAARLTDGEFEDLAAHLVARFGSAGAAWRERILRFAHETHRLGRAGFRSDEVGPQIGMDKSEAQGRVSRLVSEGYLIRQERHSRVCLIPETFVVSPTSRSAA